MQVNSWAPRFGPVCTAKGCRFCILAKPEARIDLVLENAGPDVRVPLRFQPCGLHEAIVKNTKDGTLYHFMIDGNGPFPDPASRYQPRGVHGPSQVVDASLFSWKYTEYHAPCLRDLVLYELHIGAFTPKGTFVSAIEKLDTLRDLGITAIDLMPVADFAGDRNWGYDGVALYAPANSYGTPDEMRMLIDAAHGLGLAVYLDVVYNHLGPDGAYHSLFAPQYFSNKHKTPWGNGPNFDGDGSSLVRGFCIDNALYWVHEFHIDGLRVDATHTIQDTSELNFLAELTTSVHAAAERLHRPVIMIAEDDRNERKVITPVCEGGLGFDAVYSDDFHHHMRRRFTGDLDGYFVDFDGSAEHIAATLNEGWFFQGQHSSYIGHARGTSPKQLTHESRVFCLQNHDQVGNRAFGERLSTQVKDAEYRAATALLLLAPETPLIFMGQEWAAPQPFQYFTNHAGPLGQQVTEGRRREFARFAAFADTASRETIPDPQAIETFLRSKLDWKLLSQPAYAACWRWYQALLRLRRKLFVTRDVFKAVSWDDAGILLEWKLKAGAFTVIVLLNEGSSLQNDCWRGLQLFMSSEDNAFCADPKPATWNTVKGSLSLERAGAAVLGETAVWKQLNGV